MSITKKSLVFICCICIHYSFVPQSWSEMDWSIVNLKEQMVSPPSHITDTILFGSSVAISDQYAIIGSKENSQIAYKGGSAYIFEKKEGKWLCVQEIVGSENNIKDYLGTSVALTGNYVFAGALKYDLDENNKDVGIVYVYQRQASGDWIQTQTLMPDTIEDSHSFGCSMATYNTQLVVGAFGDRDESGKVFLFELEDNQWIQRHCLIPDDPDLGGRFGCSVDIYQDYIIVGAYLGFDYQGAVYIFQRLESGWKQMELIKYPILDQIGHFGYAVSINDHYAAVGSKSEKENAGIRSTGAVYVYQRNNDTWEQMPKLLAPNLQKDDKFGLSIDLEGNILAVGGTKMDSDVVDSGSVNIYRIEENSFSFLRKIAAQQPRVYSLFASSLAMNRNNILIGAIGYVNSNEHETGSAYFYSLEMPSSPFGPDNVLGMDDIIHWLQILSGN